MSSPSGRGGYRCHEHDVHTHHFHGRTMAAKQKLTLYFSEDVLTQAKQEALRQDRSVSWLLETAWKLSREHISSLPGIEDIQLSFEKGN